MPKPDAAAGEAVRERAVAAAVVRNPQGIHLRPATDLAQRVAACGCRVTLVTEDGRTANAASVLELALLGIPVGSRLEVTVEGAGAEAVAAELAAVLERESPE